MDRPLVISVVAPINGVEKFIGKFAESLLSQSYPHVQYIFVNDGTKDASMDVLDSIINGKYTHLRDRITIVNKENGGLPSARKAGMQYATGDYVWHVDSDDWLEAGSLARIAEFAECHGLPDVIYFDFYKEYPDRTRCKTEADFNGVQKDEYIRRMYNHKSYGCVWNKCVKRSIYIDNDVFFPCFSYAEDTYLMTQLTGYSTSIAHLKDCLYHYRKDNPDAITKQNRKKRHREYAMNFLDLYERYASVASEDNPVHSISDDMIIQAGWYSIVYNLGFFKQYPYLASAVSRTRLCRNSNVCIPLQILTKIYASFIR
jgi:glycosyltransferase involved in cell wall biosynthesis